MKTRILYALGFLVLGVACFFVNEQFRSMAETSIERMKYGFGSIACVVATIGLVVFSFTVKDEPRRRGRS